MKQKEIKRAAVRKDLITKVDPQRNPMIKKIETEKEYIYSNDSMMQFERETGQQRHNCRTEKDG